MPWGTFLRAHWQAIAAADFFTVEAWTLRGLTWFHVLFVIDLETRRVRLAGITEKPTGEWVMRVTRSLVDGAFPDGQSALMLVAARLRHVAGTRWGLRRYLDMSRLREMDQAATDGVIETAETTAAA